MKTPSPLRGGTIKEEWARPAHHEELYLAMRSKVAFGRRFAGRYFLFFLREVFFFDLVFLADALALALFFLFPNAFSQFSQNFGFVPVRTIGPPTENTSLKNVLP